jgi:RHS repeat-associated protein
VRDSIQVAANSYREHTITWIPATIDGRATRIVDKVELAGFGGATATYDFEYDGESGEPGELPVLVSIPRECGDTYLGNSTNALVYLLRKVVLPDGSTYEMPDYLTAIDPATCARGVLQKIVLPTHGAIEWSWGNYFFPQETAKFAAFTTVGGVRERRTKLHNGALDGTWKFEGGLQSYAIPPGGGSAARESVITIKLPSGDKTEFFYSVWPHMDPPTSGPAFTLLDFGLPCTRLQSTGTPASYLSSRVWDCDAAGANCTQVRPTYVRYEQDSHNGELTQSSMQTTNRRESCRGLRYEDDPNVADAVFAESTMTDYDGLGHYRQEVTGGTFDAANVRTSVTNFNPGKSYPGFQIIPATTPWILGTFSYSEISENQDTDPATSAAERTREEFNFNSATGFLNCVRTLKTGVSRSVNDLLVHRPADSSGNLASERYYGGNRSPIGNTANCPDGGTPDYRIDHTYQYGAKRKSKYNAPAWYFLDLDLDLDPNTALPTASRDPASMKTTYTFDTLGRITEMRPQAKTGFSKDAWTKFTYDDVYPVGVHVEQCKPDVSCTGTSRLSEEWIEFDAFGRLLNEVRRIASGADAKRVSVYDAMGRRSSISTWYWEANPSGTETSFSNFDPFGRARTITAPDGTTTLDYDGVRKVKSTRKVALALGGAEQNVDRFETYDRQGRLFRVEESSDNSNPGTLIRTDYAYDEAGRLRKAWQNASGTTRGQTRLFNFDNRGYLVSETHPEKGSGGGAVFYGNYDASGHAWRRRDGVDDTSRQLDFTFDAAERLQLVKNSAGTVLKEFVYDQTSSSDAGLGRLDKAIRRNEVQFSGQGSATNYQVTETYEYGGRMGRPSKRTTQLAVGATNAEQWVLQSTYDSMGGVDQLTYPVCSGSGCSTGSTSSRPIDFDYEAGRLDQIAGWTSSGGIGYHPSGMIASVTHANGMVETIADDPDKMARPESITVTAIDEDTFLPVTAWKSGTYSFDGSGNVKKLADGAVEDRFAYDRVSRLVDSDLDLSAPGRTQTYTFDAYGNLTSKATDGGAAQPIPVVAATNRLQGATYDAGGNLNVWNANEYKFDLLNTMTRLCTSKSGSLCQGEEWAYVYPADDERLLALRSDGLRKTWTVRGFDASLLRREETIVDPSAAPVPEPNPLLGGCPLANGVFCDGFETGDTAAWSLTSSPTTRTVTDYVWRGDKLFGAVTAEGDERHFALDHLGTVRVVTGDLGFVIAKHAYFPFGEEATATGQDAEPMKFTGHERDLQSTPSQVADDLDMMHRRFESPITGRFLSFDPIGGNPWVPQGWNRYAYVLGNPLEFVDPMGLAIQECASLGSGTGGQPALSCTDEITVSGSADPSAADYAFSDAFIEGRVTMIPRRQDDFAFAILRQVANDAGGLPEVANFVAWQSVGAGLGLARAAYATAEAGLAMTTLELNAAVGKATERLAAQHLQSQGYKILGSHVQAVTSAGVGSSIT